MDPLIGAALIGGGTSLLGGLFGSSGASSQAKAALQQAREQRLFAQDQFGTGSLGQLAALLGPAGIEQWLAQTSPDVRARLLRVNAANPTFSQEQQARYNELERLLALPTVDPATVRGPLRALLGRGGFNNGPQSISPADRQRYEAEKSGLWAAAGGRVGKEGIDLDALRALGPGLVGKYRAEGDLADSQTRENLARYDSGTADQMRLATDIERGAERFGRAQAERARRDAEESLANANRLATASLMGRGLGASSALTGAIRGNARSNLRALSDTLGGLEDQQIRLRTGLQTGRLGLMGSRDQGRTGLLLGGQDASRGLRLGALNVEQSALNNSNTGNMLGSMSSQFFPQVSPSGAFLSNMGGALAGFGSPLLGYGLYGMAQQGQQNPNTQAGQAGNIPRWDQRYWA